MRSLLTYLLVVSFLGIGLRSSAQLLPPDTVFQPKRTAWTLGAVGAGYIGSMAWLSSQWYADYPRSCLHSFNDNSEWLQMDKVGHFATANVIGRIGYDMLRWSGVEKKKALWWGGGAGFLYLTTVEVLDGFSEQWGFSWGDMLFNAGGAGLLIAQEAYWNEERILMKYSFHRTDYAKHRPDIFGTAHINQMLKDYNGQSYWLSINPASFMSDDTHFPAWLNIAIGYSGEGMLGANSNPLSYDGVALPHYDRYRQYYLSLDVDLSRIPVKNKYLKAAFELLNVIKIPAPALEFSAQGIRAHPLYY